MAFNTRRTWNVHDTTAEELAPKICKTGGSWVLCAGWRIGNYLILNDSLSEDGAGEWTIVRESDMRDIESITFGWCDEAKSLAYLRRIAAGEFDGSNYGTTNRRRIQSPDEHRTRYGHLCA